MKRLAKLWGVAALAAAVVAPLSAQAQERGRTDGPEGSEYGKGGYRRASGSGFALEFNWGAALAARQSEANSLSGPPLFVGATASFGGADWYQFDFSGAYVLRGGQVSALVGPRFRTYGFPLSFSAGLKAGAFFVPDLGLRFGISPQAGVDVLLAHERVVVGLGYALDIPLAERGITNRLFMNVGYRF
ncbi:hypothetical protein [Archangium sp.]|jgi:hypothetical protein|uniref:hypothetical protein n=1 Tax=Archangium sp. TaxID=1872627 RepID=UPI002ED7B77F